MHELLDYLNIKLTPQLQEKLEPIISEHHYKKGDKLFRPKEVDEQIFFIIKGGARSFYLKEGKEITYSFTFENDIMISHAFQAKQIRISRNCRIHRRLSYYFHPYRLDFPPP